MSRPRITDGIAQTTHLIRSVLCKNRDEKVSIHNLLPPLTSSNDLDRELYAIIAIVVRELVQSWYGKITDDHAFVDEVVQIVAHCSLALESRLRTLDWELLLLHEIPGVICRHIEAYRTSLRWSYDIQASGDHIQRTRNLYLTLNAHPAIIAGNEQRYRSLLVQQALTLLLPTEDLSNECLRTLVADVLADPVLGNAIENKLCKNWFIWNVITTCCNRFRSDKQPRPDRLAQYGLLSPSSRGSCASHIIQVLIYIHMALSYLFMTIFGNSTHSTTKRPLSMLRYAIFSLPPTSFDVQTRMPWIYGCLSFPAYLLLEGPLQRLGHCLDRVLRTALQQHLPSASNIPRGVLTLRQELFPHDSMPPRPPVPSPEEIRSSKERCVEAISSFLPSILKRSSLVHEIDYELDMWQDEILNKSLIYAILDLIMARVLPEITEYSSDQLMELRLGEDWRSSSS